MMTAFSNTTFTPDQFARMAKIEKERIPFLEERGLIEITRKRVGNVDRKIVTLESVQNYFRRLRDEFENNDGIPIASTADAPAGAEAAGPAVAIEALMAAESVATATGFVPREPSRKKQMFYNVKGGTGKSTLTAQYVMRAAMLGLRVLAIDLDGQGHLTVNLDCMEGHELPTVYDVLINDLPMSDAILNVGPMLDLVPANLGLCNIEVPLNHKPRREYRLGEAIESVMDDYDLVVADTNPAASILNSSMLVAADQVNVVCATNPLSFHGMSLVTATIEDMKREFKRDLEVRIVPNMYDSREVVSQEVLGELHSAFEGMCTEAVVNRCADFNEATKRRDAVWNVNAKGNAAFDMAALTEELLYT